MGNLLSINTKDLSLKHGVAGVEAGELIQGCIQLSVEHRSVACKLLQLAFLIIH